MKNEKTRFWTLQGKTLVYDHHHNVFWDHIERYISLLYWNSYISSIITNSKPKYIHYLDPFIGTFDYTGTKKIITQTRVDNKYPFFYKVYLYLVFKDADTGIFFKKEQISYLPKKIAHKIKSHIIPWGKDINKQIINRERCIKAEGNILFLWSGYIQQIGYDDFIKAKKLAEKAVTHYKNIAFVFAFKTEVKIDLPKSSDRIRYLKPGNEFKALIDSADVFFSPLCSRDTVIGPPLTWIEFIADRKPILTTNVKGLGNYFEKDSSILTFDDDEEFLTIIEGISNKNINLSLIGQNAYNVFKMHFDLKNITEKYLEIYNS